MAGTQRKISRDKEKPTLTKVTLISDKMVKTNRFENDFMFHKKIYETIQKKVMDTVKAIINNNSEEDKQSDCNRLINLKSKLIRMTEHIARHYISIEIKDHEKGTQEYNEKLKEFDKDYLEIGREIDT